MGVSYLHGTWVCDRMMYVIQTTAQRGAMHECARYCKCAVLCCGHNSVACIQLLQLAIRIYSARNVDLVPAFEASYRSRTPERVHSSQRHSLFSRLYSPEPASLRWHLPPIFLAELRIESLMLGFGLVL